MGNVGFWEIALILVVALVLFGPNRLPEMGKALGKAIREFRKYTSDLGTELEKARRDIEEEPAAPRQGEAQRTMGGQDQAETAAAEGDKVPVESEPKS